ncbi:SRPBCC family protein [Natrononativus amylolyticus]|uniref:SRPBCC family protein n=1 Tax=Natrononativus amylolyticus TaxID=2963434 RepID=UPI0020CFA91D|nr:SRPBCC family protein [Natrononativus amylolyticus]
MGTVEVSRFVSTQPAVLERRLTPDAIVECEGTFTVGDVEKRDGEWIVDAAARGLATRVRFEPLENGFRYEHVGGPLETLETTLTYAPENEGVRVVARSTVEMGVPPAALTDRIAAWKRRGELERTLEGISTLAAE